MTFVHLLGALMLASFSNGYYLYPRFTNASVPTGEPTIPPTNGPTAGPVPLPPPRSTGGTIPINGTTGAPPVVPPPPSPTNTTLTITGSDGNPTPVTVAVPPGLTTPTTFTITGTDGNPTVVPFVPPGSDSSPSISIATITGADGTPTPVPVTIPPNLSTITTLTITGTDGVATPIPITPSDPGDATTDPPAVIPPGASTQTITTASLSPTSTISGVTTNTVITTTGQDGVPTAVPVLVGCSICGGGDLILGGVPDVPGVYIIPGIAVPIIIGSDLVPTLGSSIDDPSNSDGTSCETTLTATNFWVSCEVTDAAATPVCDTTSSSETTGCSATGTTSTTTGSASCPLVTLNPDDGEGEDGSPPPDNPAPGNPPSQPTDDPPSQPPAENPPPPVTCEQVCDCAENVPTHACRCWCYCSDGTRHYDANGRCEAGTQRKRDEASIAASQQDFDTVVPGAKAPREEPKLYQPLLSVEHDALQLREVERNLTDSNAHYLLPRAPLTLQQWIDAVCTGNGYLQTIQTSGPSSVTALDPAVWTITSQPVTSFTELQGVAAPSDCTLYMAVCTAVEGGASYANILCRDGTLLATQNYKRKGCTTSGNAYWSDVVGVIAADNGYNNIRKSWRYMILNGDTIKVIEAVFKRAGGSQNVDFSFDDTDQGSWGKALLSTPNGRGIARLIAQHKPAFGNTLVGGNVFRNLNGYYFIRFDSS